MRRVFPLVLVLALTFAAVACYGDGGEAEGEPVGTVPGDPVVGDVQTTDSGLQYYVLAEGDGPEVAAGQQVSVHYTGYLLDDGTKFDSSVDRGQPFSFQLGAGQVIQGWDEGVALMSVGDKYKLIIPAELGYGATGAPGAIPANATLVFDVEVLDAQ